MFSKVFKIIKMNRSFQGKTAKRNQAALCALKNLGFPLEKIRKALIGLNNIKYSEIAGQHTSVASISNTINGIRESKTAKQLISEKLGIEQTELF
jgi:hypothetical protein